MKSNLNFYETKIKDESIPKPKGQEKRFDGVTIKKDNKGFYVCTHRARSNSYDSVDKIPSSVIKKIESTG